MTPSHPAFDGPLRLQFIGLADAAAALALDPLGLSALCGDVPEAPAAAVVHRVYVGTTDQALAALRAAAPDWQGLAPGPVTVLAPLPGGVELAALAQAGLTGWWPLGLDASPDQLAACLQSDRIRWRRDGEALAALAQARHSLDERRWVDRATGVLMQTRGLAEPEALRLLQGAARGAGLPLVAVARSVTEAAQWADAVNRAGRLRMLSQRVIKLAAQRLEGVDTRRARQAQGMAIGQVDATLTLLDSLPVMRAADPASRDALAAVQAAWSQLKPLLMCRLTLSVLSLADAAAETLLTRAEALTELLEAGGARRALRLVNLCGRQRMRVQRLAKAVLLAAQLGQPERAAPLPALVEAFEATLLELERAPLGSPAARATLDAVREQWLHLLRGQRLADSAEGRQALAVASDALLGLFDALTADYEHSLQLILS